MDGWQYREVAGLVEQLLVDLWNDHGSAKFQRLPEA
jgi:hypothetical protein